MERSTKMIELSPDQVYREVTVRLWGKGVVQRGTVSGAQIAGVRRFLVKQGQFILSRIDARNGAIGIVPAELDDAVVTNDFPVFDLDKKRLDISFLAWLSRTHNFVDLCKRASEGTTNRVRLKEDRFLALEITLPPIKEQQRIATWIEKLSTKIAEARSLRESEEADLRRMLGSAFRDITKQAPRRPFGDVAPLVRRAVSASMEGNYPELGIRSFGKGTFHKPALTGFELGNKRIFRIEADDLIFTNVFAWEGAIAVAESADAGRFGSHRYITCVPKEGIATSRFLCFYFLTSEGLGKIGEASPGGAGRNRTLGLDALAKIEVPVPRIELQHWFDELQEKVRALKRLQAETTAEIDALLPSILDRAFKGEL